MAGCSAQPAALSTEMRVGIAALRQEQVDYKPQLPEPLEPTISERCAL